jgi:hypothetical protein
MLLNFKIIFCISLFCCVSCSILKQESYFKLEFGNSKFKIELPNDLLKKEIIFNGTSSKEYRFTRKDSSTVFVTDSKNGSALIHSFLERKDFIILLDEENVKYEFKENQRLFYMRKINGMFIGFANVIKNDEDYFNSILASFKKLK